MRTTTLIGALCAAAMALGTVASPAAAQTRPLSQGDQEVLDAYYVMQGVTGGLLTVTATLGLTQLYNLPTAFGDGACARDQAIFGDFACSRGLSLVHLGFGVATIGSYTAQSILALEAPDLDQGTEGDVTDALGVATFAGFTVTAILGLLAANPFLLGIDESDQDDFQRVMRVIHMTVALLTAGAFATHVAVDHIN